MEEMRKKVDERVWSEDTITELANHILNYAGIVKDRFEKAKNGDEYFKDHLEQYKFQAVYSERIVKSLVNNLLEN